jgi:hypothetical protein
VRSTDQDHWVAAVTTNALAVIGFVGASQPDDINRSDHNDFRLAFGMIILTNLTLMALTGTFSILAVPCFPSQPCLFLFQPDVFGG